MNMVRLLKYFCCDNNVDIKNMHLVSHYNAVLLPFGSLFMRIRPNYSLEMNLLWTFSTIISARQLNYIIGYARRIAIWSRSQNKPLKPIKTTKTLHVTNFNSKHEQQGESQNVCKLKQDLKTFLSFTSCIVKIKPITLVKTKIIV